MATIGLHYFTVCTRGAERLGHDPAKLLSAAGINPADMKRPGWRGSVKAMSILVRRVCRLLEDESMGFSERKEKPGTFAMMTEVALTAPTVIAAIEKGIAFYTFASDVFSTRVHRHDDAIILEIDPARPDLDPDHYLIEFRMMAWHRLACWLAGEVVPIVKVELPYPRPTAYQHELDHLFPTDQHFQSSAFRLHFNRSALLSGVMPREADRRQMVRRAPLDFMTMPGSDHSLARLVRRLLAPRADEQFQALRVNEVASQLGFHPVALARRLREEGTSVGRITRQVRQELGITYLLRGVPIETIADRLGYDEARSFTRAFRCWTGTSPREYRSAAYQRR